jgi:hypothetical protein
MARLAGSYEIPTIIHLGKRRKKKEKLIREGESRAEERRGEERGGEGTRRGNKQRGIKQRGTSRGGERNKQRGRKEQAEREKGKSRDVDQDVLSMILRSIPILLSPPAASPQSSHTCCCLPHLGRLGLGLSRPLPCRLQADPNVISNTYLGPVLHHTTAIVDLSCFNQGALCEPSCAIRCRTIESFPSGKNILYQHIF